MIRMPSLPAIAVLLLFTSPLCARAQFPANADFAEGRDAWHLPADSRVEDAKLSLGAGWAVSDVSAEPLAGWQRVEVRAKGPGKRSEATLSLALVAAGVEPASQVTVSAAEVGGGWHRISAELLPPPGIPAALALGGSSEGEWLVDSVSVTPVELSPQEVSEQEAVVPEALLEGWEPDGLLDAIERPLGGGAELLVPVGALEVGLPTEVTASRAHRGSVRLIVSSRAMNPRDLTVSVQGPPGFFAPERTVTIRPDRDTVFKASLQPFFVGTRWVKMTFRVGNSEAAAPVRVTSEPSYPAPGVTFAEDPPATILNGLEQAGTTLVAAPTASALPDYLTRLHLLPPPWSDASLEAAATKAVDHNDFLALYHPREEHSDGDAKEATETLRAALTATVESAAALGPPVDLLPGPPPAISDADLATCRELGAGGQIAAPALRLPVIETRPARAVRIDRRHASGAQPCWTALSRSLAIGGVSSAIREQARLPMFFSDLAARPTGSPEADAAMLARTLVICAYQGATGWTVPARPQDAPRNGHAFCPYTAGGVSNGVVGRAYSELSRELASAVPLVIFKQTPEIGSSPDAQIGFRPFLRNDEGILALWNNTGATADLIFQVRTPPLDRHTLSVGPDGVRREYAGSFSFSEDAITLNRPVLFVTLQPGELKILSMQLAQPHIGWLASVERKPKIQRADDGARSFTEDWEERNLYN